VLEAALRIARREGASHQALLAQLGNHFNGVSIGLAFDALRVLAGDEAFLLAQRSDLRHPGADVRRRATAVLALAGNRDGLRITREQLRACSDDAFDAARTLAAVGGPADAAFLRERTAAGCRDAALLAATGEILLRTALPHHYTLLLRRDPTDTRWRTRDSLYDVWFTAFLFAHEDGIRTPDALIAWLGAFRAYDRLPGADAEVLRRQLDAFIEFLKEAAPVTALRPTPTWPAELDCARDRLTSAQGSSGAAFAERVSAALWILTQTGRRLRHKNIHPPDLSLLTPLLERGLDGSFATGVWMPEGDGLEVAFPLPSDIRAIRVANGCSADPSTAIRSLRIILNDGATTLTFRLPPSAFYYLPLFLGAKEVTRLRIEIAETASAFPACLSEIQFEAE